MEAKIKLERYLLKHNKNFKLMVVNSCVEDVFGMFGDGISNPFADIFK
jgi:hypothetical protein